MGNLQDERSIMPIFKKTVKKQSFIGGALLLLGGLFFWFSIPKQLFNTPYSTVLTDSQEQLLGAHIAQDGQWRFPPNDSVPYKFKTAILIFEDEFFYKHPGFNPISLIKAAIANFQKRKIVRGGSTLTMQVIRLADPAPRNIFNKALEIVQAFRLELTASKDSILNLYSAHAPFGGNTVGLEAAAWRYFNHPAHELTWGETALLAVLPNAPALIHPGRNPEILKTKRDRLLTKLLEKEKIDSSTWILATSEELPNKPMPLPQLATHLLDYFLKKEPGKQIKTTLNSNIQAIATQIVDRHSKRLSQNEIHNAAALIVEVGTGEVLAYVGNSNSEKNNKGHNVDIILSKRSSGSVLKPILYAAALQEGVILPTTLLPDIPTYYTNFTPKNYQQRFDGAVAADEALSRSLNIPFVRVLDDFGGEPFLKTLKRCGFTTFQQPYSHYGLSLILGGGENNLIELAGCYASMARTLNYYNNNNGTYRSGLNHPLKINTENEITDQSKLSTSPIFEASAIYHTFMAMTQLQRPSEESGWEHFSTSRTIAWKTGTSFGFRDGWAIGVTPEYVVAVWVGNASGEGRPGIVGGLTAGPILFELFNILPSTTKFNIPYDDMIQVEVCSSSGHRASIHCNSRDSLWTPITSRQNEPCPYHQTIHLTSDGRYRTTLETNNDEAIKTVSYFVLPPLMESYYKRYHPSYRTLPPFSPRSKNQKDENSLDFIYPGLNTSVILPIDLDGTQQKIVLRAVHRRNESTVYWHLDGEYIGTTKNQHDMEISPTVGKHLITIIDEDGNRVSRSFNCLLNSSL